MPVLHCLRKIYCTACTHLFAHCSFFLQCVRSQMGINPVYDLVQTVASFKWTKRLKKVPIFCPPQLHYGQIIIYLWLKFNVNTNGHWMLLRRENVKSAGSKLVQCAYSICFCPYSTPEEKDRWQKIHTFHENVGYWKEKYARQRKRERDCVCVRVNDEKPRKKRWEKRCAFLLQDDSAPGRLRKSFGVVSSYVTDDILTFFAIPISYIGVYTAKMIPNRARWCS